MLALFRAFAKSWIAKILFAVLIVSFGLFFGINDMVKGHVSNAVISVGGRDVEPAEFKQIVDQQKQQVEQQQNGGQPIPMSELYDAGFPQKLAQQYASQVAFEVWLGRVGLKPSDKLVGEQLRRLSVFFNPVTGAFDKDRYLQELSKNNLTPSRFEGDLAEEIANEHLGAGFSAAMHLPRIYGAFLATMMLETRDASWFAVDERIAGTPGNPTDAQLQQYLSVNAARYRKPDMRAATVVLFSPELVARSIKVSDQELKDAYDKGNYVTPENRTFIQIAAPGGAAQAQAMANAIRTGGDPEAVARAQKQSVASFADRPQASLPYPKIAAAVFGMKAGEVQAVQAETGWAVVSLKSVTPSRSTPFEKVRADLDAKIRQERAKAQVDDLAGQYQTARDKGSPMQDAARLLNLPVVVAPLTSDKGVGADGKPATLAGQPIPPDLLKTLFSTPKGGDSEVEQAQGGLFFALHVDQIVPAAVPPLTAIHDQAAHDWQVQEAQRLITAKADELAGRVRKGEALQAVATSVGARLQTQNAFKRPQPPQSQQELQALLTQHPEVVVLNAAFGHSPGDVFITPMRSALAITRVDAVHTPPPALASGLVEAARPRMSVQQAQDLFAAARDQARVKLKARVYDDRIAAALGVEDKAKAKGKPK